MKNLKSLSITTDGNAKRISLAYDVIDDAGKVVKSNKRVNRVVSDDDTLKTVKSLEEYAETLMED